MRFQKFTSVKSIEKRQWNEFKDSRGSLSAVEFPEVVPFLMKRMFYLYDIGQAAERGNHAHKSLEQFMICLSGSVEVVLTDKYGETRSFQLERPNEGLYIPSFIWTRLSHFSKGAVCIILASEKYDENDYIRDYQTFLTKDQI